MACFLSCNYFCLFPETRLVCNGLCKSATSCLVSHWCTVTCLTCHAQVPVSRWIFFTGQRVPLRKGNAIIHAWLGQTQVKESLQWEERLFCFPVFKQNLGCYEDFLSHFWQLHTSVLRRGAFSSFVKVKYCQKDLMSGLCNMGFTNHT